MTDLNNYITLEEFVHNNGVKPETVLKLRHKAIEIIKIEDKLYVQKGTRYPYDGKHLRNISIKPESFKKISILKATSIRRYIDHSMLCVQHEVFTSFIAYLLKLNLIKFEGLGNKDGANLYSITDAGEEFISKYEEKQKDKKYKYLEKLFAQLSYNVYKGITEVIINNKNIQEKQYEKNGM